MVKMLRPWAMGAIAVLLLPMVFGMATERWWLAGVCVAGMVAARFAGTYRVSETGESADEGES